ncbi:hypothetical protein LTR91_014746 [Friedmanniomyces endolithicus]|uniref:Uncharacterized protein n=2 Tax=Dothideomycetidae TaxID=451867 RepID=A0AAN6KB56_9PEZI|nr:hypothetical protein LTR03_004345 [Friedmanniomyces endolithicus]KAK0861364.1 hypothetical protein LTS02_007851 [Friedmanniomyces endolithicus]KAK0876198.1 hypothetical protein LTR87_009958 [Friedmanniomyces endolithicus]KAK0973397.1 hypothetical protein LTR91_014746 [Friedmanniomyces endolithicus]KAK0978625.1 hypothetical protein LTS01_012662 [Friedmanniomyces endolithicus]
MGHLPRRSSTLGVNGSPPTIIGTVMVTVNEATNKTQSTTVYNEEYTTDGGTTILTRTDTDAAGTVTQDLGTATLAYPTPYFTLEAELVWNAILPQNSTAGTGTGSCCGLQRAFCQLIGSQYAILIGGLHILPSGVTTSTPIVSSAASAAANTPSSAGRTSSQASQPQPSTTPTTVPPSARVSSASSAASTIAQSTGAPSSASQVPSSIAQSASSSQSANPAGAILTLISSVDSSPTTAVVSQGSTASSGQQSGASSSNAPTTVAVAFAASPAVTSTSGSATSQLVNSVQSSGSAVVVAVQSAAPGSTNTAGSVVIVAGQSSAPGSITFVGSGEGATSTAVHGSSSSTLVVSGSPAATLPSTSPIATAIATKSSSAIVFGGITASPVVVASASTAGSGSSVQGLFTALSSATQYAVDGQTLTPGSSITIGSGSVTTIVALATDASQTYLVVGSSTSTVQQQSAISSAIVFAGVTASLRPIAAMTAGSNSNTVLPASSNAAGPATQYVEAGQTLVPGSSITVGSGEATTVVALRTDSSNTLLIVGSSTSTIGPITSTPPALTIGSSVIAANSNSQYVVAGQTLVPGSTITVGSGGATTMVALQTDFSHTVLVVGSSTATVGQQQITGAPPALTIGSSVIAANSNSQYLVGSQTLVPGGSAITVSGTVISLASGAIEIVVGTQSEVVATGLGGYIWSGLGAGPTASTSAMGSRSGSSSPGITSPGSMSLGSASPGSVTSSVGGAIPKSAGVHSFTASGIITIMVAGFLLPLIVVL